MEADDDTDSMPRLELANNIIRHRVADANFAVGDQNCIGLLTDATNGTR